MNQNFTDHSRVILVYILEVKLKFPHYLTICAVLRKARSVILKFALFNRLWRQKKTLKISKEMTEMIANIFHPKARRKMSTFCQYLCIENRSNMPCSLKRTLSMNGLKNVRFTAFSQL